MSKKRIGVVGLAMEHPAHEVLNVHHVLAGHEALIIGRMEVPFRAAGLTVIALIIQATTDEVGSLTGKLGQLPCVRVKTSFL